MLKLIIRDLFIYQRRNLIILPAFAAYFVVFFRISADTDASFTIVFIVISLFAMTMTAQTAFAYDETCKFNRFLRAMPIPPETIVLSRYLSSILSAVSGCVLVALFTSVTNSIAFIPLRTPRGNITPDITAVFISLIVISLFSAVLMPILFKFGYMKTKYPLLLLFCLIAASGPLVSSGGGLSGAFAQSPASVNSAAFIAVFMLVSLFILYGSVKLTVTIFKTKEQ